VVGRIKVRRGGVERIEVGGGGVERGDGLVGDVVKETALVVGLYELRRDGPLEATGAELDGGAPSLHASQGPREALLHPSVERVQPPEDLVEGELEGGIHGGEPKWRALISMMVSNPTEIVNQ
jgi:hypothetical protein